MGNKMEGKNTVETLEVRFPVKGRYFHLRKKVLVISDVFRF